MKHKVEIPKLTCQASEEEAEEEEKSPEEEEGVLEMICSSCNSQSLESYFPLSSWEIRSLCHSSFVSRVVAPIMVNVSQLETSRDKGG